MANYDNLISSIKAAIKPNGTQAITGQVLQDTLLDIVSQLGKNYAFGGVATPSTNPGTPEVNTFYVATEAGTYTNMGGVVLKASGLYAIIWEGEQWLAIRIADLVTPADAVQIIEDNTLSTLDETSKKPVNSQGIAEAIEVTSAKIKDIVVGAAPITKEIKVAGGSSVSHGATKVMLDAKGGETIILKVISSLRSNVASLNIYASDGKSEYVGAITWNNETFITVPYDISALSLYSSAIAVADDIIITVSKMAASLESDLSLAKAQLSTLTNEASVTKTIYNTYLSSKSILTASSNFDVLLIEAKDVLAIRYSIVPNTSFDQSVYQVAFYGAEQITSEHLLRGIAATKYGSTIEALIPEGTHLIVVSIPKSGANVEVVKRLVADDDEMVNTSFIAGDALLWRKQIQASSPYYFTEESASNFDERAYYERCLAKIPSGASFIFITDTHWTGNTKKSNELISYIRNRIGAKYVVNGGDNLDEGQNKYEAAQMLSEYCDEFYSAFGEGALMAIGNHDCNSTAVVADGSNIEDVIVPDTECWKRTLALNPKHGKFVYDTEGIKTLGELGLSNYDLEQATAWFKKHYYLDDEVAKVRYIVLETCDCGYSMRVVFGQDVEAKTPCYARCLLLQLDFMYEALATMRDDWTAIIVGHWMQKSIYYDIYRLAWSFKNRTTYSIDPNTATYKEVKNILPWWLARHNNSYKVDYNFTGLKARGKCLFIGGHEHADRHFAYSNVDGVWSIVETTTDQSLASDDAIRIVWTNRDAYPMREPETSDNYPYSPVMESGTVSENCFDVITLTEDSKAVFTRFGGGARDSLVIPLD